MKPTIKNKYSNMTLKVALMFVGLLMENLLFAQTGGGTHPGADPTPFTTPIDGGILMAILALSGLGSLLIKRKKDKK